MNKLAKNTTIDNSYLPVAWDFLEIIKAEIIKKSSGKVFYFNKNDGIEEAQGAIVGLIEKKNQGVFLKMDDGNCIRIDLIITLFGKIGAAYDRYDAFANACMDCNGGYSKEELEDNT